MRISIEKVNGKWLINGKCYSELSDVEKTFFDEFIIAMRLNWELEYQKKLPPAENYVGEKI